MNRMTILVVEDDRAVRNLITTTLKANEYHFLTAKDGETGAMEAASHNPDVVLLDLGLPDMDGVEVIRKIRSWSNMPIIVISARSEDADKINALDAGADARILDSHNQIRLIDKDITLKKSEAFGPYFSLFPLEMPVDELTIRGAKYPLKNHFLKPNDSLCVSNEFAEDEVTISFVYGKVILMETRD